MLFKLLNANFSQNKLYHVTVPAYTECLLGVYGSDIPIPNELPDVYTYFGYSTLPSVLQGDMLCLRPGHTVYYNFIWFHSFTRWSFLYLH